MADRAARRLLCGAVAGQGGGIAVSNLQQVRRRRRRVFAMAVLVSGALAAVSLSADTIFPDGDTGVASPNLAYGSGDNAHACASLGDPAAGAIRVNFNGNDGNPAHHFAQGESLTVTLSPAAGSGIIASAGPVPNVPATWGSDPSDSFTIPISTTVPSAIADGSYAVEVTVQGNTSLYTAGDGAGSPGKPKYQVLVSCASGGGGTPNTVPSVAFSSPPSSAVEGDVKTFNFAITDPDSGQTFSYAAGSPDCGSLGSVSGTPSLDSTAMTGSFSCSFPDGLVPATASSVSVQVTDGVALSDPASTTVAVSNANPVVGSIAIPNASGTACTGGNQVGLGFSFSDAGVVDNPWAVDINWGDASPHGSDSLASQGAVGPYTHTYSAGSYTPSVSVTDKDTGSGNASAAAGSVSFLYSTGQGILQPINYTGPRSLFKLGSTIPVKVKITDCNGNAVATLKPQVTLVKMDGTPDGTAVEDVISTVPDQGTSMRFTGSPDFQYIYNLGTKYLSAGDF
jgi:hypothetical protein